MAYTQGKAGVIKRRYEVYFRAHAPYSPPTSLSGVVTLLSFQTFKLGILKDKTLKMKLVAGEKTELNDGTKKVIEWLGTVELEDVNVTAANVKQLSQYWEHEECDLILNDDTNEQLIIIKGIFLDVEENENSGDLSSMMIRSEKLVSSKATFRERLDYSAFS